MKHKESFPSSLCGREMHLAERELSAFINAVSALYGLEESLISAEDWLEEWELVDGRPLSEVRDWRAVTIAASVRLANRLNLTLHHRTVLQHSEN